MNENQKKWFSKKKSEVGKELESIRNNTIKWVVFYNVLFAILYGLARYKLQVNYQSFDIDGIQSTQNRV